MIAELLFFVFVVILWVFEFVPPYVTALLVIVFAPMLGFVSFNQVQECLADDVIMLFIGVFVLTNVMVKHNILKKIFLRILPRTPIDLEKVVLITSGFTFLISAFLSNTVVTSILLPIVLILANYGCDNFKVRLLLSLTFFSNLGGLLTPMGTPPNGITLANLRNVGVEVTILSWFLKAAPVSLTCGALCYLFLKFIFPVKKNHEVVLANDTPLFESSSHKGAPSGFTITEILLIGAFLACVFIWVITVFVPNVPLWFSPWVVCLVLWVIQTTIPRKKVVLLELSDIQQIPWDTIILFTGGLVLGEFVEQSQLLGFLKTAEYFTSHPIMAAFLTVLLSNFASNTASASVMTPIFAQIQPSFGMLVGLASSFGFLLPVSTPTNALIYGTGLVPLKKLMVTGLLVDILGLLVLALFFRLGFLSVW